MTAPPPNSISSQQVAAWQQLWRLLLELDQGEQESHSPRAASEAPPERDTAAQ